MIDKKALGKKSRAQGKIFENKVREYLERDGWIVFKNHNDVSFKDKVAIPLGVFKQAKSKWNPFTKRPMSMGSGFPDYIAVRQVDFAGNTYWDIKFFEAKLGKYLDAKEKEKCQWIVNNLHIPIQIVYKGKKRGEIVLEDFNGA